MPQSSDRPANGGVLDLSEVEPAPVKVKLSDGKLYDMQAPTALGPLALQRIVSRYRRAQEIMAADEPTDEQLEEMTELLVDVACVVVPSAPREQLGRLPMPKQERLIRAFCEASPELASTAEATGILSTSGT